MSENRQVIIIIVPKSDGSTSTPAPVRNEPSQWMQLLTYWLYMRAMRSPSDKELSILKTLIVMTVLLIIVLALVAVGATDVIADVLKAWPAIP